MTKRIPAALIRKTWLDDTLTAKEAAARLGVSTATIYAWVRMLGLPAHHRKRTSKYSIQDDFGNMWMEGVLAADMAVICGCSAKYVGELAARRGLPPRRRGYHQTITLAEYLDQRASIAATRASNP